MAVDANVIKSADLAKVAEVDFVDQFAKSIAELQELLGITRKVEKTPGQVIKAYKVSGTLASGTVAEGEVIPLSKYKTTVADTFELTLSKYRKQTTLEAIEDKGYSQAVTDTDQAMLRDIQSSIRSSIYSFLNTGNKFAKAEGTGLQETLANTWAKMRGLWEDYGVPDSQFLYFVNPTDCAGYLASADVTVQTAFGMSYIEQFMGMYNVVTSSQVTAGTVIATAQNNLILYHANPANSEVAQAFEFTTDETGLVGVHHETAYDNLTTDTVALCGVNVYAELVDHCVTATIKAPAASGAGDAGAGA